ERLSRASISRLVLDKTGAARHRGPGREASHGIWPRHVGRNAHVPACGAVRYRADSSQAKVEDVREVWRDVRAGGEQWQVLRSALCQQGEGGGEPKATGGGVTYTCSAAGCGRVHGVNGPYELCAYHVADLDAGVEIAL